MDLHALCRPLAYSYREKQLLAAGDYEAVLEKAVRRARMVLLLLIPALVLALRPFLGPNLEPGLWALPLHLLSGIAMLVVSGCFVFNWGWTEATVRAARAMLRNTVEQPAAH